MQTSRDTDKAHVTNKHYEIGWAQALSFASTEFINHFLSMIGGIESIAFRFSAPSSKIKTVTLHLQKSQKYFIVFYIKSHNNKRTIKLKLLFPISSGSD